MANNRNYKLNRGDFISSLPDDVLLIILSKLNIAEQARTSILSSRWTNLWTFYTYCLNIDAADFIPVVRMGINERTSRTLIFQFICAVDQILRMQRGQTINHFKLTYPPNHYGILGDHLKFDGWIDIAKQKQVKHLYVDFGHCIRIVSLGSGTFSSLVTLTLKNPDLCSEIIHNLLSNSPNLLELSIIESASTLKNLSISGSSLRLKRLELIDNSITFLEISAPNLVSFSLSTYDNILPRTCLNNLTLLTQLSCPLPARREFYALLPQLIILKLTLSKTSVVEDVDNLPVLINLKQMHVEFFLDHDESGLLHWLLRLFEASPYLCRLSFDFGTYVPKHNFIEKFSDHKFLEDLEIHNFKGFECEVEPLVCIAESSSSLQKIIIHPSSRKRKVEQDRVESAVKKLALRLLQKK